MQLITFKDVLIVPENVQLFQKYSHKIDVLLFSEYNKRKPSHNWLQQTVTHSTMVQYLATIVSIQKTGLLDKVCLQELTKTSSLDEIQTDCMHFNLETSSHF